MDLQRFIRTHQYLPLLVFAASMGMLEAIVVVYVRDLFYPSGFQFPLKAMPSRYLLIEWVRELSTLLMLGSVAWAAGKLMLKRLSVFLYLFGIWDIVYYVGLKIFLDWPESLLTWDILFLIPVTWVGPVLAPVICSLVMIAMAFLLDYRITKNGLKALNTRELILIFSGAAVIYLTFTIDFSRMILQGRFLGKLATLADDPEFTLLITTWMPEYYHWDLFTAGMGLILFSLYLINRRCSGRKIE